MSKTATYLLVVTRLQGGVANWAAVSAKSASFVTTFHADPGVIPPCPTLSLTHSLTALLCAHTLTADGLEEYINVKAVHWNISQKIEFPCKL